ncbi:FAD-dependent monooxygenase [Phreatobacter aquaticus]|uniref:FAD-dependent monooxygenase n=1 Tax=Phreatobacter aquaticus TaxID=2570229 RepID=A0A4D7QM46_9HYPH|nr:NAD(P)/FAD-dependent oxidoreductase [Phreatobacter aquaticus]QCK87591.1 FAD-dependent monooxygenase [Phreatobacter aquaticus]
MKIVIVGAGVVGSILTRSLSALPGIELVCLEKVSRDDQSEAGTGLNICPNAVKAMHGFDRALHDVIDAASLPWRSWRVSLTNGRELFNLPISSVSQFHGWRIRWSELYRLLRDEAGPSVRFDCTILSFGAMLGGSQKTFVEWEEHGTRHRIDDIDLLIGADGRYSAIRKHFSGAPPVTQIGVSIFRALVPDTSAGLIDDYEQWFNGHHRLLAFRVPPGHIYIAGTFPIDPNSTTAEALKTPEAIRAAYTPADGPPGAQAQWMIDIVSRDPAALHWARVQYADIRFHEDTANVLYLGDSAHGMVPTLGQGATQAVEDACVAAALIRREWQAGRRDPQAWLALIDDARRERVRYVMDLSLEASDTILAGGDPVAGSLHKVEPDFLAKLERLYGDVHVPQVPDLATA